MTILAVLLSLIALMLVGGVVLALRHFDGVRRIQFSQGASIIRSEQFDELALLDRRENTRQAPYREWIETAFGMSVARTPGPADLRCERCGIQLNNGHSIWYDSRRPVFGCCTWPCLDAVQHRWRAEIVAEDMEQYTRRTVYGWSEKELEEVRDVFDTRRVAETDRVNETVRAAVARSAGAASAGVLTVQRMGEGEGSILVGGERSVEIRTAVIRIDLQLRRVSVRREVGHEQGSVVTADELDARFGDGHSFLQDNCFFVICPSGIRAITRLNVVMIAPLSALKLWRDADFELRHEATVRYDPVRRVGVGVVGHYERDGRDWLYCEIGLADTLYDQLVNTCRDTGISRIDLGLRLRGMTSGWGLSETPTDLVLHADSKTFADVSRLHVTEGVR